EERHSFAQQDARQIRHPSVLVEHQRVWTSGSRSKFIRGDTFVQRTLRCDRLILAGLSRQSEGIPRDRSREYILVEFIEQEKLTLVTSGEVVGKTRNPAGPPDSYACAACVATMDATDAYIVDGSIGLKSI